MKEKKTRTYYWLKMVLWLAIFSLFGILYVFVQANFPESLLLYYLALALCFISWLVFVYYCIKFNMTNKFTKIFEIKFKK